MDFKALSNLFLLTLVIENKAGYTATLIGCGWAGAMLEKVIWVFGQGPYSQKSSKTPEK